MLPCVLELSSQETLSQLRHYQVADKTERFWRKPQPVGARLPLLLSLFLACCLGLPASCQTINDVHLITNSQPVLLAQTPPPGVLPTDATKGNFLQDQATVNPGVKLRILQKLPAPLWIQFSTELTNRLDTNVFLTEKKPQPDMVFRTNPNLTLGYNVLSNTSVYVQYFCLKDCYTVHHRPLTEPITQSIAFGARHYFTDPRFTFGGKVSTYADFQARELFQSKGLRQADLNPSFNVQYFATQRLFFFGYALLQMRSGQLFGGPQREMDPFYGLTAGYRRGPWYFSATDTFVTNFREPHFSYSVPAHGNVNTILDFEVDRQVPKIPGLQVFVRAEPVFNWRSAGKTGLSGFDFRLYGGLRLSLYKQSYLAQMNQMKKALQQQDDGTNPDGKGKKKGKGKGTPDGKGNSDGKTTPPATPAPGDSDPKAQPSQLPGGGPDSTPSAFDVPAPAFGGIVGPTVSGIVAPGLGAIIASAAASVPTPTSTESVSGAVIGRVVAAPAVLSPLPLSPVVVAPMVAPAARKTDVHARAIEAQKTALEPQA
jgi:hypothetical protein